MPQFSIIICTYNPEPEFFKRLLNVVLHFDAASPRHEVIIVDNNSIVPLSENKEVQSFLRSKNRSILISEKIPGLTSARLAGIRQAQNDWIIFFDDDNEPAKDYLINATEVIALYPQVGAWGPGHLQVQYYSKTETAFLQKIKWLFQQRDYRGTHIDNNSLEGSIYYPFGTGMIIRKEILQTYMQKVLDGVFTMSDRKEKNLTSAGDLQILYTCIASGYYAGSSDKLKLNHLINGYKATPAYACRLVYALNSSQLKAYNEVFPERVTGKTIPGNKDIVRVLISAIRTFRLNKKLYSLQMFVSKKMGELNAAIIASGSDKPSLLSVYEKWINL